MSAEDRLPVARSSCSGPLIWYDDGHGGAILRCSACDYLTVTGNLSDSGHAFTPIQPEWLAPR